MRQTCHLGSSQQPKVAPKNEEPPFLWDSCVVFFFVCFFPRRFFLANCIFLGENAAASPASRGRPGCMAGGPAFPLRPPGCLPGRLAGCLSCLAWPPWLRVACCGSRAALVGCLRRALLAKPDLVRSNRLCAMLLTWRRELGVRKKWGSQGYNFLAQSLLT